MMPWMVEYTLEAAKDLEALDNSVRLLVLKAIKKVSLDPLFQAEVGYGKPPGTHTTSKLAGYLKIKLLKIGLRVVYKLIRENDTMRIIIISVRDDETVYRLAQERIK